MSNLIVMVGPPGSGKSTFSKQYVAEGFTYINQDSQGRQHLEFFEAAILAGENVIVDRLGFTKQQRSRYLDLAKKHSYETEIVVLHQPREVCLQRCLARVGHETIKEEKAAHSAINMFFSKYERVTDDEATKVTRIWPEGLKPLAVIVDIDGTIANIEHRRRFVRPDKPLVEGEKFKKDWNGFFSTMHEDKPNGWCVSLVNLLSKQYSIVFCSGRPDNYKNITEIWLDGYVKYDNLFMRPRNDSRKDSVTKEIILDFEILPRYVPYFMIDDRQQVVDLWRSRGYVCLQCDKGDF